LQHELIDEQEGLEESEENRFYEKVGWFTCTVVTTFDQFPL
jgi:hypothetical protein